ncbi:heterokaryon incompatibility protein-domain-containing protein [Suillus paluster]|uniref:heterokaryon incompatibility protein-domain-containing protein n=1 Tax=Suillus paluster TaxID=48578 RepID=UPI001B85D98B|nr:heterokaryon incompatibility protein-domain-containing protein [Suillus paluster]KAG1753751.1 heterokaryon incompatibility protein-domain-containing protein [Suillus paluster]
MDDKYPQRLEEFEQYVMNHIPIRLIRVSDMEFVGRDDMRKHLKPSVPKRDNGGYRPSVHVKYAILSHRWLASGEPTYEEMKAGKAAGPGYEKLTKFCEQVRQHKLEFAWSDTCCIDKSSSTELDESIRSMFRWYRNSRICIVHLAQSETIEDILLDEWTRRGWTLQELLAPLYIKFFNKHWTPMTNDPNDKGEEENTKILRNLEKATHIPRREIYWKFNPGPFKVDERMVWAAERRTTRIEDVAYSLMGIFGVSLQIAYGEGGDRAFCRLIDAIMQAGDASVLNWKGEAARHHTSDAIPRSPKSFMDRRDLKLANGRLEMTMTGLGLRVPLVILPLNLPLGMVKGTGNARITFNCLLYPTIKVDITVDNSSVHGQYQYALGIINYSLVRDRSREVLGIQGKSVGFPLKCRREPERDQSVSSTTKPRATGFETVSDLDQIFGQWRKIRQEGLIEVNFPTTPNDPMFYISRKYLEIVYL